MNKIINTLLTVLVFNTTLLTITNADDFKLNDKFKLPVNEYLKLPSEFTDVTSRKLYYEKNKKNHFIGGALSFLLPGGGQFYMKDWGSAIPVAFLDGFLMYFLLVGDNFKSELPVNRPNPNWAPGSELPEDITTIEESFDETGFLIMTSAFIIVKTVNALITKKKVGKYNQDLKTNLNLTLEIKNNNSILTPQLGFNYSF